MNYQKIEDERRARNLTLEDFANKIGVSQAGYNQMLRSQSMKIATLEKIAEVLQMPVSSFFEPKDGNSGIQQIANGNGNFMNVALESCQREVEALRAALAAKDELISLLKNK